MSFHTDTTQTVTRTSETAPEPTKRNPWLRFAVIILVTVAIFVALAAAVFGLLASLFFATDTSVGEDISSHAATILHTL